MTAEHNKVRAQVGVAPLSWSPALGGVAQQWADYLATENNCQLTHRPAAQQQYGENLYWHSATASAVAAAGSWAAEAASYTYQTGACSGVCGHYTQMVWADTRYVGCGFARCTGDGAPLSGGEIIVCNYDPRGNYVGQKPY
ncbi:MAG: hypothetical protein H6713_14655 [Myxococcales bacterium]|nr:hypothetical protein [Myxococcales bacterium]